MTHLIFDEYAGADTCITGNTIMHVDLAHSAANRTELDAISAVTESSSGSAVTNMASNMGVSYLNEHARLEWNTDDYINYVGRWNTTPTYDEFKALQNKVKELEDMIHKLWQAKAVGDLL